MRRIEDVQRRWWQYKRTWFLGIPALVVLGAVGMYAWGTSQPKPAGFAPTVNATSGPSDVAAGSSIEASPDDEPPMAEADSPQSDLPSAGLAEPVVEPIRYTVDARSKEDWILFDFDTGDVVHGDFADPAWDIALQRTNLLTNSGVTNASGPGGAIDLGEVLLTDAVAPEFATFAVDVLGGEDEDEPENPEIGGWYKYSFIRHVISVKPNTYVIRTGEDRDVLLQFDSYYCEDDEPACITFQYLMIPKVADSAS